MTKRVHVHWIFKEEPTLEGFPLCVVSHTARDASHSIVLRPVIRQKPGSALRECPDCAKVGKELGIP
jgi:hypothetical protein